MKSPFNKTFIAKSPLQKNGDTEKIVNKKSVSKKGKLDTKPYIPLNSYATDKLSVAERKAKKAGLTGDTLTNYLAEFK
tara:strand:+ start:1567 stop:1800 length:234 start_codon:yes stop_codon:yes gene_type:complete